ncbi:MAG: hypothetical protein EBU06_02250, partial [Micrococcales bacterium]|nr:hypothetical protein [Micrococcales bacterium]
MQETVGITTEQWDQVVSRLAKDERMTKQLMGFVRLINVQGVMGDTLFLQVANEMTRGFIETRIKDYLLEVLQTVGLETAPKNLGIVVNPELTDSFTSTQQVEIEEEPVAKVAPVEVVQPAEGSSRLNPR